MEMYLKIANTGEIQKEALTLLGGSGNKYALAYFLREGIDVRVFSGEEEIRISKKTTNFRNTELDVICIDGKETSITTSSGPQWEFWHAVREIYSNALDEGLIEMQRTPEVFPIEGETQFYIKWNSQVADFYNNIGKYFSYKRTPVFSNQYGKIFEHEFEESYIFRKGIRCYESKDLGLFDYDFENVSINESREPRDKDEIITRISNLMYSCDESSVINKIYQNFGKTGNLEFAAKHGWISTTPSLLNEKWKVLMPKKYLCLSIHAFVLEDYEITECHMVTDRFYNDMIEKFGEEIIHPILRKSSRGGGEYREITPNNKQSAYLKEAENFFEQCDYEINRDVIVVKFSSEKKRTQSNASQILVSDKCFSDGKHGLITDIMGEMISINANSSNEYKIDTAIKELINYMAEKNAYVL